MSDVEYDVTYFKGQTFPLSNFYRADLFVFDRWLSSSEYAYQWRKAFVCGNLAIANQILATKSPVDAKRLVRPLEGHPAWNEARKFREMAHVALAKFHHVPAYRQSLIDAGDIIAEAVPHDRFWSAGHSDNTLRTIGVRAWPGRNIMGLLHMAVRTRFMRSPVPPTYLGPDYVSALYHVMQASLGAQPGTGLTAPSVSVTMQEQSIRPRLGSSTATSLVLPSGVVAPPPPPPGFPARLPPRPLVPTASLSRAPVPVPTPSPLSRPVTYNVPTDTLRARSPPFPMAMSSGATVSSVGPSPSPAMRGPFGPPQATSFAPAMLGPFGPPQAASLAPAMPGPFGPPQASTLVSSAVSPHYYLFN